MNGDTVDAATTPPGTTNTSTPVRRSARARKPNSRFADDEVDSCFKKIVSGLASPECTSVPSPGRPRKAITRRKDSRSEEVEERSDRVRKDSKDDEEVEERGRKLSEGCEEKKRKERSDELEERIEHGKKASQNEETSEDLLEESERRKENMEEKREKRSSKDSQSDESVERKDQSTPSDDKPLSHSLPNGLETGREVSEECTRVTRSGRPVEESRRKTRKRGKGKEEQEDQETVPEPVALEQSQDSSRIRTAGRVEEKECIERTPHPQTEPSPDVCEGGNEGTVSNSDGEGAKELLQGVECSPVPCSRKESVAKAQSECEGGERDSITLCKVPENVPKSEEGSTTRQDEVDGLITPTSSSSTTPSSSSSSSVASMTNGDADTGPSLATTTTSIPTTTTTVTTTPATTITAVTTTTTAITVTRPAITNPSTTTTITITHSKQLPPGPVPPPLSPEAPTDPRLHRGTRGSSGGLSGRQVLPQTQREMNTGTCTPSMPPLPPDTPTRKGGAVPVLGGRRSSRDGPREPQGVKSPKILCENIPLPPELLASPKHGRQMDEPLRRMGGKRERREKEESTPASQKAIEDKEETPSSPLSKRRKETDAGRKEKVEESKEEETKRKRLEDAKEEDKRKRRKVEETEEKEENTPKTQKETPLLPSCPDISKPSVLVPTAAPSLPPVLRKAMAGLQNSPKTRRESRESLTSPRVERDNPKDSPRRNRESLRNKTVTLDAHKDTKDIRSTNSFCLDADSGKAEEGAKEGCDGKIMKTKEECGKGEKGAVKCERELLLRGKDTAKSDRDTLKGNEDVAKSVKGEKEVIQGEKDADKSKDNPAKSERSTVKSSKTEKDNDKSREESPKVKDDTAKSGKDEETIKSEKDTSTREKNQEAGHADDPNTVPGLFFSTQETEAADGGMGVFLGFSTSSTAIPFLEDTPSTTTEEIPGLSILASSDTPRQRMPPKKERSHRSWFAIGSNRRNQNTERTETAKDADGESKEEKEVEEIALPEEKKEEEKEKQEEEPMEVSVEVKEEETKEEEDEKKEVVEEKEEMVEEVVEEKEEEVVEEEKKLTEEEEEQLRKEAEERAARNRAVVEERLKSFSHLQENVYIGERKRSKRNKEVRRMVCDCSLTKEEMERGEVGCGDDCLNRLLMIECGSRCPLGDRCINKRFLHRQYGDVEVFNAEEKGCGLRARSDLPPGTFIMEYVGEVFDTREFKKRRKEYARDMRGHFYFMALKSDQLIDATMMGNISRFINHSCDPNAETQKWTVNGDLRIGFFSKRYISAGEEINFDYRLERYGREPQRCYCGVSICRGWLGEAPDEQTKEEKDEARRKEERDRRKREERRAFFEDIDLEEEIEKLNSHKLRNRQDTLNLSRLMVRAEDFNSRVMLLQLLQTGESACRRLFLDYHGLKVLWSWMADLGLSQQHTLLKVEILQTLEVLPITNKTQLTDSRVLSLVERWSGQGGYTTSSTTSSSLSPPPSPPPKIEEVPLPPPAPNLTTEPDPNKKSSDTSEESDSETDPKQAIEASSADDSSLDSEVENPKASAEEESSDSNDAKDATAAVTTTEDKLRVERLSDEEKEAQELLELHNTMVALAKKLLDAWKNLKEFFRIPKKERIEMMKEHEREVDRGYKEYLDQASESDRDKDRDRYNRRDHYYERRRRSPDRDKERYSRGRGGPRDDWSDSPKMSKEQRRQLFEIKVQQQEEEAKQRKMQEEMWTMHVDRCRLLGHDPYLTPIFDPTYQYFWDPVAANWQPYTGSVFVPADPNLPVPAGYGLTKGEGEGSPLTLMVPSGRTHLPGGADPPGLGQGGPNDPLNPANIPLPGEMPALSTGSPTQGHEGTPPHGAKLLSIPLPGEATTGLEGATPMAVEGLETPSAITIHLPPRWHLARDATDHVYFYHVKTRVSQWEPPVMLNSGLGSDSSSDSSSESDSDSSSTTDSEDFSTEEEEEEEEEAVAVTPEVSDEKMIRRPKGTKRRRSEALVQERVISPIMEVDKEAARRERREAKERAREEARQERQEERNTRGQKEEQSQSQPQQQQQQQQEQEEAEVGEAVAAVTAAMASVPVERERERERDRDRDRDRDRRSERHEARAKREKVKSKERAASAIADNSDAARKIKDTFRSKMATFIVSVLNPYRRSDCREGKITCTEDFKYLARKLTHFVMVKELKQLHSIDALECSDSVKHKTRDFVRKYMSKYGSVFKRDPNDTKEY